MEKVVTTFLERHWDQKSPLLLGYSGGPDSKALLYALKGKVPLHVAHVDHGWREESAEEAEALKQEIEGFGLPFHTTRLAPFEKNREAHARKARLKFFSRLCKELGCSALLLAHHADDLAETVLKRIFEGAHLSSTGGMSPVSCWEDLPIWRPLLSVKKAHLLAFLEQKNVPFLLDATNADPTYLRTRLRQEILPRLSHSFGKEIVGNLLCFSERAYELKDYLERKCSQIPALRGPWGAAFFLQGVERFEARYLLHKYLPRTSLEIALDWIEEGKPNQKLTSHLFLDRGVVFVLSTTEPTFPEGALSLGVHRWGDWEIEVSEERQPCTSDWKQVWTGQFAATFPVGEYSLQKAPQGKRMRKRWNGAKVPAFFREKVPILVPEGEFLSGRKRGGGIKISFKFLKASEVERGETI